VNAVMVKSDAAEITMLYGAGAGSEETASAVIADLVVVARVGAASAHQRVPHLAFHKQDSHNLPVLPKAEVVGSYYLRVDLAPDVQAQTNMLQCLAKAGIGVQTQSVLSHHQDAARMALAVLTLPIQPAMLRHDVHRVQALHRARRAHRAACGALGLINRAGMWPANP
jgi:homoserine dehydrogenase